MKLTRRAMIKGLAALPAARWMRAGDGSARTIAPGAFTPDWESLRDYRAPDWFRDAKFGIWAHWSAQCVPEQGDWYARNMYIQGEAQNKFHVEHYGHPSKFGFMEIDRLWKAENWDPEALMQLYVKAGAKYFMALANHHDNFDCYDSTHQKWNALRVGPKRDIVGIWEKTARKHGLRFAVSNHSAHAWHWFQTAYGYDPEGPKAGIPYDGFLTKQQGKGKWWDGLDPQELYVGQSMVLPKGFTTVKEARDWHNQHDRKWTEEPPPEHPEFVESWFRRCQELVDKYKPDLLYFDDTELPLGQAGLDIAAHYYNSNMKLHGNLEAVLTSKGLAPNHVGAMVLDIERGRADHILEEPWQTDTCIGDWHYNRSLFENHKYKTLGTVIRMLVDIVSKNGNLMLNIPVRGDGTIDDDERAVLDGLAGWMKVHGEAIYGTRPFSVFGEGPPDVEGSGNFNENQVRPYTAQDIRFTTKGNTLYAFALGWPADGKLTIRTLAARSQQYPGKVGRVELLSGGGPLKFTQDAAGLVVTMPPTPNEHAWGLKILRG